MSVERLNFTRSSKDNTYLDIPDSEIVDLRKKTHIAWERSLRKSNVKPLWNTNPQKAKDQSSGRAGNDGQRNCVRTERP